MPYKCFTSCLCCNITTATAADTVLKYFWNTAQLLLQVSACIRYIHTQRPLAFYAFNRTKFALRYLLLYVVYTWQKSFNYIDAFNYYKQQEAQLMLTNLRNTFGGQSRSPNIVPFHMLHLVSYCAIVTVFNVFTIFDFKKCRDLEIGVKGH